MTFYSGIEDCAGASCREHFESFVEAGSGNMHPRQEPLLVNLLVLGLHVSSAAFLRKARADQAQCEERFAV